MALKWNYRDIKDASYATLISRRITNILLIANPYDAFILEDDGRIEEKMFAEYMELRLRYPPQFTKVSTPREATHALRTKTIDLVICMPGNADHDAFAVARRVKRQQPSVPCVVLTPFSHDITRRIEDEDLSIFDYVFCWLGNTNLLLSIIKLLEDKMNVAHDTKEGGVQVLLLVEDSIRYYSAILPNLYNYVLQQSKHFATEALNVEAATLRMRGRPKIMLARTYAEAKKIYDRYHDNILGVISDASFPLRTLGAKEPAAGLKLLRYIRSRDEYVPLVMESNESSNRDKAQREGFHFVDKNTKALSRELHHLLEEHFGFGDFIFREPTTKEEVARVRSLKELQDNILTIPHSSLMYHVSRNHVSRWLAARALFPLAEFLKRITWHKLQDVEQHRQIIYDAILYYRKLKNFGVVAVFDRAKFDRYAHFARIGDGSLGGKGRGLAFLDQLLKSNPSYSEYGAVSVQIPKTVVLCTDLFDTFMEDNDLYPLALSDAGDDDILRAFLAASLPSSLAADLQTFIAATHSPLAIRSSSLLEDGHCQPFAGIYSTYMIPYLADDSAAMSTMLLNAIKGVYASVFYKAAKAYMLATSNMIDQEKMAVVVQQVVGEQYGDYYYPTFSAVLRSRNAYPIGREQAKDGVAHLAIGLGKYIVDGGTTLRVCPSQPKNIIQIATEEGALRDTQREFMALNLRNCRTIACAEDDLTVCPRPLQAAKDDGSIGLVASTYIPAEHVIRDGVYPQGRPVATFAGVLKNESIPLATIMKDVLALGEGNMRRPIEMEMAGNIYAPGKADIYLLQIRPIGESNKSNANTLRDISSYSAEQCLATAQEALGEGIESIADVVYVKVDDDFSPKDNAARAKQLEHINSLLTAANTPYILAGPGRWGSQDPWLGIPVKWQQIAQSRVIIELSLPGRYVEPSQGTHFFHNITSLGVGYLTITCDDGTFRQEILDALPAVHETALIRHVRFTEPLTVIIDGQTQRAVVVLAQNKK